MQSKKDAIQPLIFRLERKKPLVSSGNKAANLLRLVQLGMRVPQTCVLSWDAYLRYAADDVTVVDQVLTELREKMSPDTLYAVRSSANIEDSFEHSFAGQFKTVLNVQGAQALMQAVWSVWATARTSEVRAYLQKRGLDESALRMAVILQEMVSPVFSGVAFSRNPLNGMSETVVEAVKGLGTALVQEGATPYRWTFRSGKFTGMPENDDVPMELVQQIVAGTHLIAQKIKRDVDLEWVYDGKDLYWVQMREITSLRDVKVYSNSLAREMIGGIIKPLIWSINIPLKGGVVINVINELTGHNDLTPDKLIRPFYYRAYFNMGLFGEILEQMGFPADSLEMMWGLTPEDQGTQAAGSSKMKMPHGMPKGKSMMRLLPRMVKFVWTRRNLAGLLEKRMPELEAEYRAVDLKEVAKLSPSALIEGFDRLYRLNKEAIYYDLLAPMAMYIFATLLRKQLKRFGYDFAQLDMHPDSQAYLRFDPNHHLRNLHLAFKALPQDQQEQVRQASYEEILAMPSLGDFRQGAERLMRDFGHLCDHGNDFSTVPWRENTGMILRLVTDFPPAAKTENAKVRFEALKLPLPHRWTIRWLYERARRFQQIREHISYLYTFGYGLFRVYFLALARHFVQLGWIEKEEDIFYLKQEEIRAAAADAHLTAEAAAGIRERIRQRRSEVEAVRDVSLPTVIFGDDAPPVQSAFDRVLRGTPTSRGYCTGPVKVVSGLQDFPKVQPGDVLVIPFSDVGWTPLFSRAAGVIAESGGMLSHSSIVAREYGIPAIVSVPGATLLRDGVCVSMDGYKGEILIHQEAAGHEAGFQDIESAVAVDTSQQSTPIQQ